MKPILLPKVPFDKLSSLFSGTADSKLLLDIGVGDGFIQYFKPEKGLRVKILDCSFFEGVELYDQPLADKEQVYFTLAYFPDTNGVELISTSNRFRKPASGQSLFVSAASDFRMSIAPATRCRCVSVRFSRDWLLKVLQTNHTLQDLQENFSRIEKLEVLQSMTPEEREVLDDLFLGPKQQHFRSFYIKATVLKLVCDFLQRLKDEQAFLVKTGSYDKLDEVEQYLNEHITKEFAGTKEMAKQFAISESTLKRHFKKKFGVSTTVYLTRKKMQYAGKMMQEKAITLGEAARLVGYRSVQNFKEVFSKYFPSQPVNNNEQKLKENSMVV